MHALPLLKIVPPDNRTFSQGSILRIPTELCDKNYLSAITKNIRNGWQFDQLGYATYAVWNSSGLIYAVPAIMLEGTKVKRKFVNYTQTFTKSQIEKYLHDIIARDESYRDHAENDLNLLVHDLRQLSSAIYHQATEALDHLKALSPRSQSSEISAKIPLIRERLQNVVASQTMLKIRTDLLDFEGAPDTAPISDKVPVYRRFDKVKRCFEPIASSKDIVIKISGQSRGYSRGPDVFEIIPYVLIDNAVKYSPKNSNIDILFSETTNEIICSVSSTGPKILNDELNIIFTKGYRGKIAQANEKNGSGLGLFLAKSLLESFRGNISVESVHRADDYCLNIFTVRVPKLGEMTNTKEKRKNKYRTKGASPASSPKPLPKQAHIPRARKRVRRSRRQLSTTQ